MTKNILSLYLVDDGYLLSALWVWGGFLFRHITYEKVSSMVIHLSRSIWSRIRAILTADLLFTWHDSTVPNYFVTFTTQGHGYYSGLLFLFTKFYINYVIFCKMTHLSTESIAFDPCYAAMYICFNISNTLHTFQQNNCLHFELCFDISSYILRI